jgi:exonuclease SbcD
MRFIHTADWHLGARPRGASLAGAHEALLAFILGVAAKERPDVLIIAGDVFDRKIPPPDAISLLDSFLSELVLGLGIPALVVSGNHDSADRLSFGERFLSRSGLHVVGSVSSPSIAMEDAYGPVSLVPLPHAEPALVRHALADASIRGHDDALRARLSLLPSRKTSERRVAVFHGMVSGGLPSASERPLGPDAGAVRPELLDGFDHVAIGHLHRPQAIAGRQNMRYSGSIIAHDLDEIDERKSIAITEINRDGTSSTESVPLPNPSPLRLIEGTAAELRLKAAERLAEGGATGERVVLRVLDGRPGQETIAAIKSGWNSIVAVEFPRKAAPSGPSSEMTRRNVPDDDEGLAGEMKRFLDKATLVDADPDVALALIEATRDARRLFDEENERGTGE